MITYISGTSEYVSADEWHDSSEWYANKLLGKRMSSRVTLYLDLAVRLQSGRLANITPLRDTRNPREFIIQINTTARKRRGQLTGLAHEMIHLRQMARNEFRFSKSHGIRWKKKGYQNSDDFSQCPWEVEAYENESILFKGYDAARIRI